MVNFCYHDTRTALAGSRTIGLCRLRFPLRPLPEPSLVPSRIDEGFGASRVSALGYRVWTIFALPRRRSQSRSADPVFSVPRNQPFETRWVDESAFVFRPLSAPLSRPITRSLGNTVVRKDVCGGAPAATGRSGRTLLRVFLSELSSEPSVTTPRISAIRFGTLSVDLQ